MREVSDDSGFLASIVPAAYETFVASNWTLDQILAHFKAEMERRTHLIWGTGLEEAGFNQHYVKPIEISSLEEILLAVQQGLM
jgi:hypothetical protein